MKKRILFFDHDKDVTGSTVSLVYILRDMIARGAEVWVASPKNNEVFSIYSDIGCKRVLFSTKFLNFPGLDLHSSADFSVKTFSGFFRILKNLGKFFWGIYKAITVIIKVKPALVYVNEYVIIQASIAAWLFGIPNVVHLRSLFIRQKYFIRHSFIRECLVFFPDHLIAITKNEANQVNSKYFTPKGISVVTEFIEIAGQPDKDRVKAFYEKHRELEGKPFVLFMGGVWELKGSLPFLQAAKLVLMKNANVHFVVIGRVINSGSTDIEKYFQKVQEIADDCLCNNSIHIYGHQSDIDIFLSECCMLVSANQLTHFSRPIIEAWNNLKPVVSTNTPHAIEYIENGVNGLITPSNTVEELADAIQLLLNDKDLAAKLARAGKECAKQSFDIQDNLNRIHSIVENLVDIT